VTATFWVLLGELLASEDAIRYLLIGNAVAVGFHMTGWAIPAATWDRWDGTYALLIASPSSIIPATVGRTAIFLLNGVATTLLTFAVLIALFGFEFPMPAALAVVPLVLLICLSHYCFATFLGSIASRVPRLREVIINMQSILFMTICGVSVPVAFWPIWVGAIAQVLPVTHGLGAIRTVLDEGPATEALQGALLEMVVAVGWLTLSVLLIDRLAEGGRRDGSIEAAA
jgi:ABC-2 type transport system permease protein